MARKYKGAALPVPNVPHPELIYLLRRFSDVSGITLSDICRQATHDPKLLWDMNGGRKIGGPLKRKLYAFIEKEIARIDDGLDEVEKLIEASRKTA